MRASAKQERRAARLASSRRVFAIFIADDRQDFSRRRRAARLRSKARRFETRANFRK